MLVEQILHFASSIILAVPRFTKKVIVQLKSYGFAGISLRNIFKYRYKYIRIRK